MSQTNLPNSAILESAPPTSPIGSTAVLLTGSPKNSAPTGVSSSPRPLIAAHVLPISIAFNRTPSLSPPTNSRTSSSTSTTSAPWPSLPISPNSSPSSSLPSALSANRVSTWPRPSTSPKTAKPPSAPGARTFLSAQASRPQQKTRSPIHLTKQKTQRPLQPFLAQNLPSSRPRLKRQPR